MRAEEKQKQAKWYQLYVKIKMFNLEKFYTFERKVIDDSFIEKPACSRKWYISEGDLIIW